MTSVLDLRLTYTKLGRTGRGTRGEEIRPDFRRKCSRQLASFRLPWPSSSEEEGEEHAVGGEGPRGRSAAVAPRGRGNSKHQTPNTKVRQRVRPSTLERHQGCRFSGRRTGKSGNCAPAVQSCRSLTIGPARVEV